MKPPLQLALDAADSWRRGCGPGGCSRHGAEGADDGETVMAAGMPLPLTSPMAIRTPPF